MASVSYTHLSCLVQGVIPYGSQMLMAAGISQVSPLLVMKYLYYPLILGICSTCLLYTSRCV